MMLSGKIPYAHFLSKTRKARVFAEWFPLREMEYIDQTGHVLIEGFVKQLKGGIILGKRKMDECFMS